MLITIMQLYIPEFIKRKKLKDLFRLTADSFGVELPKLKGLSYNDCLSKYALFTKEQAEVYLKSGLPLEEVKRRLYQNSLVFGKKLRKSLHITAWEDTVKALEVIYMLIGIDLKYGRRGEIIVRKCSFSKHYSGEVCRLISSLDEGLAEGLSDGGRLYFNQRITEDSCCCKGYFLKGGDLK